MQLPKPVMKSGLPTLPGSKHQAKHSPDHGTFDPSTLRPLSGLALIRIRTYAWQQRASGIWAPPIKDGRRQEIGSGVFSKQEWREATVLRVADDVKWITPGTRVLIPTSRLPEGRAVNRVVINWTKGEDERGSYEEFDVFLYANRRRDCHKCGSTKFYRARMRIDDEKGNAHPGPWNVKCRKCGASWRRDAFIAIVED